MVFLQRKLYFSNDPEGVQHFTGMGSNFFQGGGGGGGGEVQMLISIESHKLLIFHGEGSGPPIPLWIRT